MIIVLISGKAGVGKDTFAYHLIHELSRLGRDCSKVPFAEALKDVAKKDFNWDGNKDDKGRVLLQDIGKIGRKYFQRIWSRKTMMKISALEKNEFVKDSRVYIVPDWRFPDELAETTEFYPTALVYKVRIIAPDRESLRGCPAYEDESENSLPEYNTLFYDKIIDNSGDYNQLNIVARDVAKYLIDITEKE